MYIDVEMQQTNFGSFFPLKWRSKSQKQSQKHKELSNTMTWNKVSI